MKSLLKKNQRALSVLVAILAITIIFSIRAPRYVSGANIRDIIEQATIFGLMGIGMTAVVITGGIDLSVGSVLAFVGAVVAQASVAGWHPVICLFLGLLVGLFAGFVNGFLVSYMGLQPFIATMGTMSIFRGLAYVVTKGYPVLGVSREFREMLNGEIIPGLRISVIIFFVFAILVGLLFTKTKLGLYMFSIGGNEEACRFSGINVKFYKTLIYSLAMLGTALAAMIQVAKLGTGDPTTGSGYELNAIAAAAIGGTSMAGGRGTIFGTVLGAIFFSGLKNGLVVWGIEPFYQFIATGVVIVLAAYIDVIQDKFRSK